MNALTDDGCTPLQLAVNSTHLDTLWLLLEPGADPNVAIASTGKTALYAAAELGLYEIVQALLDFGSDTAIPS